MAFLGASLEPGIAYLLDLLGFADALHGAALVITGEGSLDRQTLRGKAPIGVARAAVRASVPVVAVAGRRLLTATTAPARLRAGLRPHRPRTRPGAVHGRGRAPCWNGWPAQIAEAWLTEPATMRGVLGQ